MARAPIIVQVRGIPGSGKSYLRHLVTAPEVAWFEADEYISRACESQRRFVSWDDLQVHAQMMLDCDIAISAARVIVCTGITLAPREDAAHSFFVKMTKAELGPAYRRLMLREAMKFIEAQRGIAEHIRTAPLKDLDVGLHARWHLHAWWGSWQQYQKEYEGALQSETARGRRALSQAKIAAAITILAEGGKLPACRAADSTCPAARKASRKPTRKAPKTRGASPRIKARDNKRSAKAKTKTR